MLQCFYARAMHSRNPKNKFRDTKAEELIDRIDYDFSNAKKDTAMSGGIVARSVVFDELVSDFIRIPPPSRDFLLSIHNFHEDGPVLFLDWNPDSLLHNLPARFPPRLFPLDNRVKGGGVQLLGPHKQPIP